MIETAWKEWFSQFAPHVFTECELVEDKNNTLYPRITFSYAVGDFFVNTITSFQVWTWSHSNTDLWRVCNEISKAVPVDLGTLITIPGGIYYEYELKDGSGATTAVASEMNRIIASGEVSEWHERRAGSAGGIEIWRGSPFLTPSPKDNAMSRVMYGTLQTRYLNTV